MGDLDGRTFLVTGANTGIGLATATALAVRGGRVHIACRSEQKGRDAQAAIAAARVLLKNAGVSLAYAAPRDFANESASQDGATGRPKRRRDA